MGVIDILNGHVKELLGENDYLSDKRMRICKQCPLFKNSPIGPICNSKLYISKDGKEVADYGKDGFVKGCGCRLNSKSRLPNAKCIIGKW